MASTQKSIWIDLDNSPHVPLFVPIISHYRDRGVEVLLTARDHAQTLQLLDLAGLKGTYQVVGRHYGKNKVNKVRGVLARALQLAFLGKGNIGVALSHGSRSMVLAARTMRIPVVTMYDYEYTETRIFNTFSDKVLVPERIPDTVLDEIGLSGKKRVKYAGIKEELYVSDFQPAPGFRKELLESHGAGDKILAVLRPPASTANYHSEKSEVLLDDLFHFLLNAPSVFTIVVPRTAEQAADIKTRVARIPDAESRCIILEKAVNGLNLAFAADLLISGGGTMNREAALLGVPVYSIFAGRQGSLDRQMEAEGLITFIRDARDLSKIRLSRREPQEPDTLTDRVKNSVIAEIDRFL